MKAVLTFAFCKEVVTVDFSTSQTLAEPPPTETRNLPSGLHKTAKVKDFGIRVSYKPDCEKLNQYPYI